MIATQADARKIITKHYPDMKFRLTTEVTIGLRPSYFTDLGVPTLVWTKVARGKDSVVKIGVLQPNLTIDWTAEVK
jgi:hypothetical protein